MNIGIKNAKGKYIIRLDGHSRYPKDYFKKLIFYYQKLNADNVGGVVITEVKNKNITSNAIKNVLSDKLGVGSAFRSGVKDIKEVDTVPFGCYKKEIFDKVGLYDERLVRNQDIELNKRIKKAGGKIYLIPEIKCVYFARETYKDLAKNSFNNGFWNILTAYYTNSLSSLSFRHFVPLIFVLSLILTFLLGFFNKTFFYIFLFILLSYLILISFRSFQIKKDTTFFHQLLAFLTLHVSYGIGSLVGIFKVLKGKIIGK
jgi:GT2 family glycosyltransferase